MYCFLEISGANRSGVYRDRASRPEAQILTSVMELNISMVDNVMEAMVSPQQRYLRCLMGAAKASKTEMRMVKPSIWDFDKQGEPVNRFGGCFRLQRRPSFEERCSTAKSLPTDHGGR